MFDRGYFRTFMQVRGLLPWREFTIETSWSPDVAAHGASSGAGKLRATPPPVDSPSCRVPDCVNPDESVAAARAAGSGVNRPAQGASVRLWARRTAQSGRKASRALARCKRDVSAVALNPTMTSPSTSKVGMLPREFICFIMRLFSCDASMSRSS
jgi:hypothetical protein